MSLKSAITGTGHYVPPKVVSNFDLEKVMNTTDEWIVQRSGIRFRHYAEDGVGSKALGLEAARKALEDAKCDPADIDFIVAATLSPDHYFPGIGVQIQDELGCGNIGALDVRAQCSGFLYALSAADQYIRTGTYKKILVVASEVQSHNLDYSDDGRDMAVLFGDGAGAVVLEPSIGGAGHEILTTHLFSDGKNAEILSMNVPDSTKNPTFTSEVFENKLYFPRMDGKRVFVNAVERMPEAVRAALAAIGKTIDDVDFLIPHQANDRISLMVAQKLGIPVEKVIRNIERFGNTTAASIPIALDETVKEGRLKTGDLVLLTAFGSGFTWASAAVRW
ncbi:MAG: ketoacyl-ACP synthase III [Candidatus Aminicenantes bacterium]|nr:ketoacyl-ACP synthase III [Candidatus Aminicenantes bacterium]